MHLPRLDSTYQAFVKPVVTPMGPSDDPSHHEQLSTLTKNKKERKKERKIKKNQKTPKTIVSSISAGFRLI